MSIDASLYNDVETCIDEFIQSMPIAATYLGDHRFDDQLGDPSEAGLEARRQWAKQWQATFKSYSKTDLSHGARIDRWVILRIVERVERVLNQIRSDYNNPLRSLELGLFSLILILQRDYAPLEQRMGAVLARLRQLPEFLAQTRQVIVPSEVASCWLETTVYTARGWATVLNEAWTGFAKGNPQFEAILMPAIQAASAALMDYADWAEQDLGPQATADPTVGRDLYVEILREHHAVHEDPEALRAALLEHLDEIDEKLLSVARRIDPDRSPAELLEDLEEPEDLNQLVADYEAEIAKARKIVQKAGLATLPEGELLNVTATQPLLRGALPFSAELVEYFIGPLRDAVFFVTPPADGDSEQNSQLRSRHTRPHRILNTAYETYPGKRLRLAVASRRKNALVRQLGHYLSRGGYLGWTIYAEEMMVEQCSPENLEARLLHLWRQRERCAHAFVDISIHIRALSLEQGAEFLTTRAGMSKAERTILLMLQDPGDWQSIFTGYLQIRSLIDDYRHQDPEASLQKINDDILSCGFIPVPLIREELLGGEELS